MVTIRGGSFTNEDLRQAKELADTVAQDTAANLGQDSRARRQELLLNRYTSDFLNPQVQVAARGLLGGYDPDFGEEMGTEVFSPQGMPYETSTRGDNLPGYKDSVLNPIASASMSNTGGISTLPQEGFEEFTQLGAGLPSVFTNLKNLYDPTNTEEMRYVSDPITGAMQGSYMAAPGDLGKMDERFMAAENNPLAQFTNPIVNAIAGMQTNPRTGEKFDMTNPDDRYDFYNLTQDTKKASEEAAEARKLDQDRLARMALAAQQPQTSDPCPEGYRLDPVSQVCVPTDDTTEPGTDTGRVYEPLAVPQANYTPYTGPLNIPSITLPDIFTGK